MFQLFLVKRNKYVEKYYIVTNIVLLVGKRGGKRTYLFWSYFFGGKLLFIPKIYTKIWFFTLFFIFFELSKHRSDHVLPFHCVMREGSKYKLPSGARNPMQPRVQQEPAQPPGLSRFALNSQLHHLRGSPASCCHFLQADTDLCLWLWCPPCCLSLPHLSSHANSASLLFSTAT